MTYWGLVAIVTLLGFSSSLCPAAAPSQVTVVGVRFEERRLPSQNYPWLEAAVNLRPSASDIPDNLSLQLYVGYRTNTRPLVYAGRAKLYALSDPATVRFYLPPDVLRSQRLGQTPDRWLVEVTTPSGTTQHASPTLITPAERSALKAAPSPPLLPHYATPFYSLPETLRDLPSYLIP